MEQAAEPERSPEALSFQERYPTIAASCLKCHSGEHPKGDFILDESTKLEGPAAAEKRDAIASAIINGRMPKGKALDPQSQYDAIVELFSD